MDTRDTILRCAEALFREKGYNQVSLRDIALAAGIRVGNLTYHFPRKELLVEAIFTARGGKMLTPERLATRAEFREYFRHLLSVQRRTAFYFDSYIQLSQTSAYFRQIQCRRTAQLRELFARGLENLAAAGELPPEAYPGAFDDLAETLLTVLMLRLPGEERLLSPEEQDRTVLRRAMALLGQADGGEP